jgi:hypothetical protein
MSKKLLDACYVIVLQWAADEELSIAHLMDAVKEYDPEEFFKVFQAGYEKALKARVAAGKQ